MDAVFFLKCIAVAGPGILGVWLTLFKRSPTSGNDPISGMFESATNWFYVLLGLIFLLIALVLYLTMF